MRKQRRLASRQVPNPSLASAVSPLAVVVQRSGKYLASVRVLALEMDAHSSRLPSTYRSSLVQSAYALSSSRVVPEAARHLAFALFICQVLEVHTCSSCSDSVTWSMGHWKSCLTVLGRSLVVTTSVTLRKHSMR